MAIFANGPAYQTASIGTSAALVFNPNSTALQATNVVGSALRNVTIVNTGAATVFLGTSSVTAATGLALAAGQQLTIEGYSAVAGNATGAIYGITSSGTAFVEAGLETTNATV